MAIYWNLLVCLYVDEELLIFLGGQICDCKVGLRYIEILMHHFLAQVIKSITMN